MVRRRKASTQPGLSDFRHDEAKRKNNPPAKIAGEGTVPAIPKAKYAYSPRLPTVMWFDDTGRTDVRVTRPSVAARAEQAIIRKAVSGEIRESTLEMLKPLDWHDCQQVQRVLQAHNLSRMLQAEKSRLHLVSPEGHCQPPEAEMAGQCSDRTCAAPSDEPSRPWFLADGGDLAIVLIVVTESHRGSSISIATQRSMQ